MTILRVQSHFEEDHNDIYEDRYGINDGEMRSWEELSHNYDCDPEEACFIVDEIRTCLDANSPYRFRSRRPEEDPHRCAFADYVRSAGN